MRTHTIELLGLFLLFSTGSSYAQEARAVILGRVADASGAGIVGAKVKATSLATGADLSSVTGSEGDYQIPYLQPGQYKITVEARGFKTTVREAVDARVGERLALDFTLEVGEVSDTVSVTSEAPLIDTASASSGMVIDSRRAGELPTVGGNAFYLARLAPGVLTTGGRSAGNPFDYGSATGSAVVNGTRTGSSEVSLDGASNMFERNSAFSPPQDLVAEFKIQTLSYDASIGHTSGAVTNVSIKSGTKDLHGTVYYNDSPLRAVPWHTNRFIYDTTTGPINDEKLSRNIPTWRHQRWGVTATGPVIIPRLYDGRQKTFWSFGYEGLKIRRNLSFTGTVPTQDQRRGNFSALLAPELNPGNLPDHPYQIYDPETIAPAGGGRFRRDIIPGNIIPEELIDPVAKRIMEYWPLPNQPGTIDGRNNYFTTQDIDRNNRSILARMDHNFSENHRLFVRFNQNRQHDTTIPFESASVGTQAIQPGYGAVVDDVYTFNSTLVLNLRYGLSYQKPIAGRLTEGFDLSSLGFPASLLNEIAGKSDLARTTFPNIRVDNTASADNPVYAALGTDGSALRTIYTHSFSGTVTKIIGAHSLKTGAEYRLMRENGFNSGNISPRIDFGSNWTRGPLDNSPIAPIGQGFASFLLGHPTGGLVSLNTPRAQQSDWTGVFIHDDWRVNSKLTLNLGIRYEYESAPTERFNRSIRGFDFNSASPISERALTNYAANPIPQLPVSAFRTIGGLTLAGVDGQPRGLWESDKNNFMPRIGLAYSLTKKTVVRAGYGIYYDSIGIDRIDVSFNQSVNLVPTLNNGLEFIATLADPFPDGLQSPPGSLPGLNTFLGRSVSFFNGEPLNPYVQRWSLAVQQELPGRMVAEVTYVGSRATKLGVERNLNAIPRQYLSTRSERDQPVINFLTAAIPNPFFGIPEFTGTGLGGLTVQRSQLLRPYPHFQDITVTEPVGYSWYHALQLGVEKRLTKGLTFQASWTYSKFMEAINYLNDTDLRPEEVVSDQDFPHRFVLNGIYELPFGKGRKWFNGTSRLLDYAIGGWQLQGWFEGQSGEALGFGNAIVRGDLRDIVLPVSERTSERWFNFAAANSIIERNSARQLANNIRALSSRFGFVRADGVNNFDLSLFKNFQVGEGVRVQFRVESFNALNHVQFVAPNTTVTNTAFGSINNEKGHGQRQITFGIKILF
jgi:hypothetical protein